MLWLQAANSAPPRSPSQDSPAAGTPFPRTPFPMQGLEPGRSMDVESARWKRSHLSPEAVCSQEPKMMWGLQQLSRELQEWLTLGPQPAGVRRSFLNFLKNCRTFPANSSIITHVHAKMALMKLWKSVRDLQRPSKCPTKKRSYSIGEKRGLFTGPLFAPSLAWHGTVWGKKEPNSHFSSWNQRE